MVIKFWLKRILSVAFAAFAFINVIAFFHAWKLSHFSLAEEKFVRVEDMTQSQRLQVVLTGLTNPRSKNEAFPSSRYKNVRFDLPDGRMLDTWTIPADEDKGTIIMFHGFRGQKSSLLTEAEYLQKSGYNVWLVDFTGHGDSKGNYSTMGYTEAEEVKYVYDQVKAFRKDQPIILFGSSMGAVAITRAVGQLNIKPERIILQAPFGTMLQATANRFDMAGIPSFPIAQLLVFWGGVQHGFWAFKHNPEQYAKNIKVPTLLLYGKLDQKVTMNETQNIYNTLNGEKYLHIFENCGHGSFCHDAFTEWSTVVSAFLPEKKQQDGIACATGL